MSDTVVKAHAANGGSGLGFDKLEATRFISGVYLGIFKRRKRPLTIMFNDFMAKTAREVIEATYPRFLRNTGGALWLERVG